ncbi:MAG: ATP-dependent RNA helicase RhlE [Marivirga sp.]|jgi:ATP-dependent RNA helicase RhlE
MASFEQFNLPKPLNNALQDMGFTSPTPIQEAAFNRVLSGKDLIGISQTGTGKTLAYMLPILHQLKFSKEINPRVLIMVPTRELVGQLVSVINSYTAYMNVRVLGVYGEANIKGQIANVAEGLDIIIATPGRLYDLVIKRALILKDIQKVVIDEVDVMLDLGFWPQLRNILELLPTKRQHLLFSATMTEEVDELLEDFFNIPDRIAIAPSGTPLANIAQQAYEVPNFYTKLNLLVDLLRDKDTFEKVIVFITGKKMADKLFDLLAEEAYGSQLAIIHSNKSQNFRIRSVEEFENGEKRILIATDVIARGLDLDKVSHVISFDAPAYPEIYMHRIGRTGRAQEKGNSLLFFTERELEAKEAIETLMHVIIPTESLPEHIKMNPQLLPEERTKVKEKHFGRNKKEVARGASEHEKKEKNQKVNMGGSYKRKLAAKHKKPQSKGPKGRKTT